MKQLIKGASVLSADYGSFEEKDLLLVDDRIGLVGRPGEVDENGVEQTIDAAGKFVIPGLINAHSHSYAGLLKGSVGPIPLDIYMLHAIAGGSARSERAIYVSAMIDAVQMLRNGITSVVDHFAQRPVQEPAGIDAVMNAFKDSGMRAVVAPMYSDKPFSETVPFEEPAGSGRSASTAPSQPQQSPEAYIRVCEDAIGRWNGEQSRVAISLGTDGPQRCSDKLLGLTRELEQQYRCGWQTHVLEGKTQVVMSHRLYGKGLVEHMAEDLDLLNERMSLVHAIWLNEREIRLVAERGSTAVHCPRSNLYLGSGTAPVPAYRRAGVPVALGTDGGNLGALEMFDVMRLSAFIHRLNEVDYHDWPTARDALTMACRGGARVMQRPGEIGSITAGSKADLTILNPRGATWWPRQDALKQIVYYEDGRSVDTVIVDGEVRVENGAVVGIDEAALFEEAQAIAEEHGLTGSSGSGPAPDEIERYRNMYLKAMRQDLGLNRFHG